MSDLQKTGTRKDLTGASTTTKSRHDRGRDCVRPLAREEISRKLASYAATAAFALFLGLVVVPLFTTAVIPLQESARFGGRIVDFFFLAMISILSINALSYSYTFIHRDPFGGWLVFLTSLPVSPREIVLARSLIMLPATLVMTTLFFVPLTAFAWSLDPRFALAHYLWFGLFWLGYALFFGGINLYIELGVKGKVALAVQFVSLAAIILVAWLLGGGLVHAVFGLAGEYGPLFSGLALLFGGAGFALFAGATERRVGRREVGG